jgi:hypothetical protein
VPDTEVDDRHVRPFAEWLLEQGRGALAGELSDRLNELVEAVHLHGKGGSLTLTVKVAPAGKNGHTVVVSDEVKSKLPEGAREDSIWFVDGDCNLVRHDPHQQALPLREVDPPVVDVRDITKEGRR